jgi:RNA polymerase sigma factor (sigma-70 family)
MSQSLYLTESDKYFELLKMRKGDLVYNDFLLIRKMKQGDDNAFDLFVHKYYQEILSYCHHHCFDKTYAEDLTQETFIRFFTRLPDYHYKGKTLNYLYTIAGNLCKDYLKKTKEILLEENEFLEENQTEENQAEQILNRVLIEQVLEQLPDELRDVLTLYYFQELKLTEISGTLQIGLPLVKYRLQKARKQLKELLGKEELHESERKD